MDHLYFYSHKCISTTTLKLVPKIILGAIYIKSTIANIRLIGFGIFLSSKQSRTVQM